MKLRPVLFISYNFPPHGGPGVQRSTKFVKYLPEFGWLPVVITTSEGASPIQDPSLLADVGPEIPIIRVPGFNIYRLIERVSKYGLRKLAVLLNLFLQIPDAGVFWAKKVKKICPDIIDRYQPRVIYTTSGPYSSHLVGQWLKERYSLPWLADFRDPWSGNLKVPYLPGYRWFNHHLERNVLRQTDYVVCVSEPWLNELKKNLTSDLNKFKVLPNGYDDTDIQPNPFPNQSSTFVITHLGSFYRNSRPEVFVRAINLLTNTRRIPKSAIKVILVGKNPERWISDEPPFKIHDYVPHKELDRFRADTHSFLLILDTAVTNIGTPGGKLYEYIASNRPIIGIVPPGGEAERLIAETRTGITVDSDPVAIADAIERLYTQWKNNNLEWNPNWEVIRQFTRRNITRQLAEHFNQLANVKERVP